MFRNYLTSAWRNLVKNGMFSVINVSGLAIGLMSCILIMIFVRSETGYDTWVKDHDRIVRMHTGYMNQDRPPFLALTSAGRMMPAIRDYAKAEVEEGVRLINAGITIQKDGNGFSENVVLADSSMFGVFDLPFRHGSVDQSWQKPFDTLVSEELAIKYFGRTDVIGETLTMCCLNGESFDIAISGVIKDIPENSHFDIDILTWMDPAIFQNQPNMLETWTSVNTWTYFKLKPGVTPADLQERIYHWVDNESPFIQMIADNADESGQADNPEMKPTDRLKHRVMPLADLHLRAREHAGNMGDWKAMGDLNMIYTFAVVAGLVLVIACINFMNLATARASKRAREVALRKVLGASRIQVSLQFLGEAIAIAFVALFFALVAVEAVLPLYGEALGRDFQLDLFSDMTFLGATFGITLLVGLGAGLYPALYLSGFLPARILKANQSAEAEGGGRLRGFLVVFQFAISITLVTSTAVVYGQTLFAQHMDTGYESEGKLALNVRAAGENMEALRQELARLPGVDSVALSSEVPSQDFQNNTFFTPVEMIEGQTEKQSLVINYHNMGYGFFEAYGVEPVAGRLFDEARGTDMVQPLPEGSEERGKASVILNESAVRRLGFKSPDAAIGHSLATEVFMVGDFNVEIIGVVPDLYFRSIKYGLRPSAYLMNPGAFRMATISYTTNDVPALRAAVEQTWKDNVPLQPVNLQFLTEMMENQYAEESAQAKLFAAFSVLAVVVACLGLYGLAAFTADRRTREIGIRKVLGARIRDIVQLLVWQFSKPVLVANIIAWPVAFWFMSDWLQGFEYRLGNEFILTMSLVAGGIAMVIAWATVASRAYRVACANPIHALRYE